MIKIKTKQHKPEIFTIFSNEIQGRLDPYFYRPEFRELEEKLENSKMEIKELEKIVKFQYGLCETAKKTGDLIYLRITDIDENGNLKKDNLKYLNYKKYFENYILKKDDILIARTGATFGKTLYFNENFEATFGGYLIRINFNTDLIIPKYYFYFSQLDIYWKLANRLVLGSGQPQFNANTISNLKIPVPPKEIQKQIIGLMDNAYNLKKQNEKKAKELIDGIDDFVLEKLGIKIPKIDEKMCFVVYSNELENNRIDAEFHQKKYNMIEKALEKGKYELQKLKNNIEYIKKGVEVGSNEYIENGKTFLRVADFDNFGVYKNKLKYISEESFNENIKFKPEVGEILFSKDGSIGFSCVLNKDIDGIISSGIVRIKTKNNLDNFYLSFILRNKYFKSLLENLSIGQIIKHLSIFELENLKIPVPPLEIQEEIAKEVKSRLEKAKELKKSAIENLQKAKEEVEKILLD